MKKYETLYQKYKNDILNGYLVKGDRLPSIRQACTLYKVSQTTAEHAYNKLQDDGFIVSAPKVGYIVDCTHQQILLRKQIEEVKDVNVPKGYQYDFRTTAVFKDENEMNLIRRYSRHVFDRIDVLSSYGDPQGEIELREALSKYAYRNRGVLSTPDQIVIGASFQSLLYLLCGILDKSHTIGVPNDCSKHTLHVFKAYGFSIVYLDPDHLLEDLKRTDCQILYINSACFGSLKRPISANDRYALLSYTASKDILLIEDDYNGELTYASKNRNAIQAYAQKDHVVYCGSFSRLLVPSMRLSYMVLPAYLNHQFQKEKVNISPTASKLEQLTFSAYIVDGYLDKHLRRLKKEYRIRYKEFEKIIQKYFIDYYLNEAYMSYVILLPGVNLDKLRTLCEAHSIGITLRNESIEISFAAIDKELMSKGISLLAKFIKEC